MHGRKKIKQSDTELQIIKEKADTYSSLITIITNKILLNEYTIESLKLTEKLLKNNPDYYNLWNYRKRILISLCQPTLGLTNIKISYDVDHRISAEDVAQMELDVSAEGIRRNPKSCKYLCLCI